MFQEQKNPRLQKKKKNSINQKEWLLNHKSFTEKFPVFPVQLDFLKRGAVAAWMRHPIYTYRPHTIMDLKDAITEDLLTRAWEDFQEN